jgi:histidyl-tRNA synthetase
MGGKDTPASGFALYLDQLMNLVKPETLAKPSGQRILIRAEPGAVKQGFSTASRLREAGYMAEFYVGGQKQADFDWTLDVQSKAPSFILTDQVKHRRFEAKTADEVLTILKKE